ncbi:MAG TPA: PAS domain S-box protein [Caldilineaceae bacterium]|nr:PAS domain S-box protein [Caldilineaceae bacterium]
MTRLLSSGASPLRSVAREGYWLRWRLLLLLGVFLLPASLLLGIGLHGLVGQFDDTLWPDQQQITADPAAGTIAQGWLLASVSDGINERALWLGRVAALSGSLALLAGGYLLKRLLTWPLAAPRQDHGYASQDAPPPGNPIQPADRLGAETTAGRQMTVHLADCKEALQQAQKELEACLQERNAALAAASAALRNEVAARQAAEEALRQAEFRSRLLFDAAPVGIFTKDLVGRYTSANRAELAYWPSDPTGHTDDEMAACERATSERQSDAQLRAEGKTVVVEQQVHTTHGERRLLTYKSLFYDSQGRPEGILGVDIDITERHQAELAQTATATHYRTLVERIPAITYSIAFDSAGGKSFISPQVTMLGFSPEEWVGQPAIFDQQLHPEDRSRVLANIEQIQQTGQASPIEYRLFRRDGQMLWVSDQAEVLTDQTGKPLCRQGLMYDITVHKQAEDALHDSVRRIQLIADNLPALIAYVDDQQIYRFANRQFEEWYTTPNINGRHLREIAGDGQYEAIRDYVDTALAGMPITFDYARTYPDGQRRFVEIAYIPHVVPPGRVLGFFALVQDVTERKVAEEQIKASLEEKVVLLKEIHHRVKNNLQVISSLLSLQSEQIGDAQVRAVLQDSQNRVRSMALIHEKLYQAKDQVRVDVAEYIQNLTSYLFRSYAARSTAIQLRVMVDHVYLGIDAAMPCGLIINELLSNALKHGFPTGQSGEVYVELQHDDEGIYTLLVGDNGVSMHADLVLHKSSSLGLQLVHTLVNQLDGSIELRHEEGVEFRIRFSDTR